MSLRTLWVYSSFSTAGIRRGVKGALMSSNTKIHSLACLRCQISTLYLWCVSWPLGGGQRWKNKRQPTELNSGRWGLLANREGGDDVTPVRRLWWRLRVIFGGVVVWKWELLFMHQCQIKRPEAEQPVIADLVFISAHPQTFFFLFVASPTGNREYSGFCNV